MRLEREIEESSRFFRPGGAQPQTEVMGSFIDQYRKRHGVEPICKVLPIAPSTYYRGKDFEKHPDKCCYRVRRYQSLEPEVQRVWDEHHGVDGARKVWNSLIVNAYLLAAGWLND